MIENVTYIIVLSSWTTLKLTSGTAVLQLWIKKSCNVVWWGTKEEGIYGTQSNKRVCQTR